MNNISVGIQNFELLRKNQSYYVDKTGFIVYFDSLPEGTIYLVRRPRRFGKSLMLSALECFYDIKKDASALFDGLEVRRHEETWSSRNSYPTLLLDMRNIKGDTFIDSCKNLRNYLRDLYLEHLSGLDLSFLDAEEKRYVDSIVEKTVTDFDLRFAFQRLLMALKAAHKQKVILLIDEYDTPIINAFDNGYLEEQISFYETAYGLILKGNERYVAKSLVTGVTEVGQTSIFSATNNPIRDYFLEEKNEYFGFTFEEVDAFLSAFNIKASRDKLTEWYGNYRFQSGEVFNPWSMVNFVQKNGLWRTFWSSTTEAAPIRNYLPFLSENDFASLSRLLMGEHVIAKVNEAVNYRDVPSLSNLYSLLVSSGYLSIAECPIDPDSFELFVANKEMRVAFDQAVSSLYGIPSLQSTAINLLNAFSRGDGEAVGRLLSDYLRITFSSFDLSTERSYQVILITLLSYLSGIMQVQSELPSGEGRLDIVLKSKINRSMALIIECKYIKEKYPSASRFEDYAESALAQIKERNYKDVLLQEGYKHILAFGISFNGKKSVAKVETIR